MQSLKSFSTCIQSCDLYNNQDLENISITREAPLCPFAVNLSHSQALATTYLFPHLIVLLFPEHHIITQYIITQYGSFHVWLLELSIMLLRLIHIIACILLLFMAEWYSTVGIHHNLVIQHKLVSIRGVYSFWRLRIKLQWASVYSSLCGHHVLISLRRL